MIKADANLSRLVDDLPYSLEEYNMVSERQSTFLDIGSGFGKPVFHAAMQTRCISYGIEIVPARVAFSDDQKYNFADYYKKKAETKLKGKKVNGK